MSDFIPPVFSIAPEPAKERFDTSALTRYWYSLRRNTGVPRRTEIDPRAISTLLPNAFIVAAIAPGLVRFRVAGSHLAELSGMDVRSMPLSAMLQHEARETMTRAIQQMFDAPAILRATLHSPAQLGKPRIEADMLILPLRDEMGDVNRAIGCLKAQGRIGKPPRRFTVISSRLERIAGPGDNQYNSSAQPFRLAPPKPGGPSHLRLVVSDNTK